MSSQMKRAIFGAIVAGGAYFALVLWLAGQSWLAVILALGGILAGLLASVPILEAAIDETRHHEEREAATAWISSDPYGFAKRIADVFAEELDEARGDKLADAIQGAEDLSSSLAEIARRAAIRRHEELLRSRTWLP